MQKLRWGRSALIALLVTFALNARAATVPVVTEVSTPITNHPDMPVGTYWFVSGASGLWESPAAGCSSPGAMSMFQASYGSNVRVCVEQTTRSCVISVNGGNCFTYNSSNYTTTGCLNGYTQQGNTCHWTGAAATCASGTYDATSGQCINPQACPVGSYVLDASGTTCSSPGAADVPPADLNAGTCASHENAPPSTNHPVNVADGDKFFQEDDFIDPGPGHLDWRRVYNSLIVRQTMPLHVQGAAMAVNWTHPYSRAIQTQTIQGHTTTAYLYRPDGSVRAAQLAATTYQGVIATQTWTLANGEHERLIRTINQLGNGSSTWTFYGTRPQTVETYDGNGVLQSVASRTA